MSYDITDLTADGAQRPSKFANYIQRGNPDYCRQCGCAWTCENGKGNVRAEWCESTGCRCHSNAFAAGYALEWWNLTRWMRGAA